jgi:nitrogen regulatory protein PII-like uncharacterized protein
LADPSRPIGPAWVHEAARDITSLSNIIVVVITTAAIAGYLSARLRGTTPGAWYGYSKDFDNAD